MSNHKMAEERVSSRVSKSVQTPIGDVLVTYSNGVAEVSFHGDYPDRVRYATREEDGTPIVSFRHGKRPPSKGDEITQNGHTFEVIAVDNSNGRVRLLNEQGEWEDWKE